MAKLLAAEDDAPNLSLRIANLEAKLREMEKEQEQLTEACADAVAKEHNNEGKALAKRLTEEIAVLLETIAQLQNSIEATKSDRTGGMATKGDSIERDTSSTSLATAPA